MSDFVTLGPDARMQVNGIMFAVVSGRYSERGDEVDNTDSETAVDGTRCVETGLNQFSLSATAQKSTDVTPHVAPLSLRPQRGVTVSIVLYPNGIGGLTFIVPQFKVIDYEGDWTVDGSRAQTIAFNGKSTHGYSVEGQ